eukprot:161069-Rhodomonas_salina.6
MSGPAITQQAPSRRQADTRHGRARQPLPFRIIIATAESGRLQVSTGHGAYVGASSEPYGGFCVSSQT